MCIENYFNNIAWWSSPAPFFREETRGLEWASSLSKLTLQRRGAALGFRSCFVLFLLYLPWPHGPSFLCGAVSETLLAWNVLILNPTEYSSHTPGRRFRPPSCSHITLHVYCLTGKCFVFTLGRGTPCLIHLLSPLLSLFFSLLPAPHKCLINVCVVATEWINIGWTAAGQWGGLISLFLHGVFPPQLSAKPALHEITYSIPWPSLWNVSR